MRNAFPTLDRKHARECPHVDHALMRKGNSSTGQRIVHYFNWKVIFWAAPAIVTPLAFFANPLVAAVLETEHRASSS